MGEGGPEGAPPGVVAEHAANGNGLRLAGEGSPRLSGSLGTGARLEAKIQALAAKLKQGKAAGTPLDGGAEAALAELAEEAGQLRAVEEEVAGYAEAAIARSERLERENAALRKAAGDAELDKQMGAKLAEAERLRAAGDAYKRELLQAKLSEREGELSAAQEKLRAAKREAASMARALTEARSATSAREEEIIRLKAAAANAAAVAAERASAAQAASSAAAATAQAADDAAEGAAAQPEQPPQHAQEEGEGDAPGRSPLASEHEEIAAKLMAAGPGGVDIALLAAAAKALRDVGVLDKQLLRAREEKAKLAREVEDLNATVFSKSFKAPSAWAEREVKYKAERRDWDAAERKLRERIATLEAENARYRADNKAAEFEARIQEMEGELAAKEAEKVAAQRDLHELQLQCRSGDSEGLVGFALPGTPHARHRGSGDATGDGDAVAHIVGDLEAAGVGVGLPGRTTPSSRGSPQRSARESPAPTAMPSLDLSSHFVHAANVEEIIMDYDDLGVSMAGPGRRGRRRGASRLGGTGGRAGGPVVRPSQSSEELCGADGLQEHSRPQSAAPGLSGYAGTLSAALPGSAAQAPVGGAAAALQQPPQVSGGGSAAASSDGGDVEAARGLFSDATLPHSPPGDAPWEAQVRSGSPAAPDWAQSPVPGVGGVASSAAVYGSPQLDAAQQASNSGGAGGVTAAQGGFGSPVNPSDDPPAERSDGDAAPPMPDLDSASPSALQLPSDPSADPAPAGASSGISGPQREDAHAGAAASQLPGEAHVLGGSPGSSGLQGPDQAHLSPPDHASAVATPGERPMAGAPGDAVQPLEDQADAPAPALSPQHPGQVRPDASREEAAQPQGQQQAHPPSPGGAVPPAADGDAAWSPAADHRPRQATVDDGASEASSGAAVLAGLPGGQALLPGGGSMGRDSSSDGSPLAWDTERRAALQADRAAAEAAWGEHVADNDDLQALRYKAVRARVRRGPPASCLSNSNLQALRHKAAEAGSRAEVYEAQVGKMQRALERADQETSRLEQELLAAQAALAFAGTGASGSGGTKGGSGGGGLAGLRDRMRGVASSLGPGPAVEAQAAVRLQETAEALRASQHERDALAAQRDGLARQLAAVAAKIGAGVIPEPAELAVPAHIAAAAAGAQVGADAGGTAGAPRTRTYAGLGTVYAGLSDEEVEVVRLRDDNAALMETLVRTKVELAETQGDYLKTRRALLRSVEKQAMQAERLDGLRSAVDSGNLADAASLLKRAQADVDEARNSRSVPGGNYESLGERTNY